MRWRNTSETYGLMTKMFHWGLALLIIGMLVFGTYLAGLKVSLSNFHLFGVHKSLGLLAFGLIILRLIWKALSPTPNLISDNTSASQMWLARATHAGLIALMILMPLAGWIASSAAEFDMRFFDLFPIPALVGTDTQTETLFFKLHAFLGKLFMGLIGLHIVGALYRHFGKNDATLRRMWF